MSTLAEEYPSFLSLDDHELLIAARPVLDLTGSIKEGRDDREQQIARSSRKRR